MFPQLCDAVEDGGLGFDYRQAMFVHVDGCSRVAARQKRDTRAVSSDLVHSCFCAAWPKRPAEDADQATPVL